MDKKRVVAYARVSTNKNDQKNSFENQQSYFLDKLSRNDNYVLCKLPTNKEGIYADKGTSGTKLIRPEFTKMLQDAGLNLVTSADTGKETDTYEIIDKPKFDVIFVKDTKRFARNTSADSILKTLRKNNVIVHFLDINKTSESLDDITVIQMFLTLAESDSLRLSKSVKFGYQEGARKGNIYMGGKIIGYDYIKKDNNNPYKTNVLEINKEEAELVKLIFDMYTEQGLGHQRICNELYKQGYLNSAGKKYTRSTISRILENEKYIGVNTAGRYTYGDVLNKKQVQIDYNDEIRVQARKATKELAKKGIVRIPPIIEKKQFEKAQEIRENNRKKYNNNRTYNGITDYAKKIRCDKCGAWYIATSRKYNEENEIVTRYYACSHRITYNENNGIPKCNNPSIKECDLDKLLNSDLYYKQKLESIEEIQDASSLCLETLNNAINSDYDKQADEINAKINDLRIERDRLLPLYAKGKFDEQTLDSLTTDYNRQIDDLKQNYDMLIQGNDKIRENISIVEKLLNSANKEEEQIKKVLITKKYPKLERRKLLADVEYINIDIFGNPTIVFKNLNDVNNTIAHLDSLINVYDKVYSESNESKDTTNVFDELQDLGILKRGTHA